MTGGCAGAEGTIMKITHIYHSGFCVELEHLVLIFDWYSHELPEFSPDKKIYCLVSHIHGDHYGRCIWDLRDRYRHVTYILDRNIRVPGAGVRQNPHLSHASVLKVKPHHMYEEEDLRFLTLLATDQGVAYVVQAEGKIIFHAGDLNIWYWDDEPRRENNWQIETFKREIDRIRDIHVDVAFLPFDPRLGRHIADGPAEFLNEVDTDFVFPMHYWDNIEESREALRDPRLVPFIRKIYYEDSMEI
jgi:L-ascorbate metabolism protein UlaG (beta-lactamase superfamily)